MFGAVDPTKSCYRRVFLETNWYYKNNTRARKRARKYPGQGGLPPEEVRMRRVLSKVMPIVLLLGLTAYVFAETDPVPAQRELRAMTVAELEKAGDARRAINDFPAAALYFEAALRQDRRNAVIYNKLGLAQISYGDMNAARNSFTRAVRLDPNNVNAINNLGVIHFRQQRLTDAAKYFRMAIALEETRAAFHVNLGVTLFSQRRIEQAMKSYEQALALDPEVFIRNSRTGVAAQITNPEDRALLNFELAKMFARQGNAEVCLRYLQYANENGYRRMADVYRDPLFSILWDDERLHEMVEPPAAR